MSDWLHDKDGNIRQAFRSVSAGEIDGLARSIDEREAPASSRDLPRCTFDVRPGDELLLEEKLRGCWGSYWVRVVRVERNPIMGIMFLLQSPDGSGGFLDPPGLIRPLPRRAP